MVFTRSSGVIARSEGSPASAASPATAGSASSRRSQRRGLNKTTGLDSISVVSSAATPPGDSVGSYVSGTSTPLTSNIATPAETLRINIPSMPLLGDSAKSLSKSIYSINRKRRWDDLDDSEDEAPDEDFPNAIVARRLQQNEGPAGPVPVPHRPPSKKPARPSVHVSALEEAQVLVAKHATRPALARRQIRGIPVVDSDSEDAPHADSASDSELSSAPESEFEPVAARSRRAGRSGPKTQAPSLSDIEGLSDIEDGTESELSIASESSSSESEDPGSAGLPSVRAPLPRRLRSRPGRIPRRGGTTREERDRAMLEKNHPEMRTLWTDLEALPVLAPQKAEQPKTISRLLKPFQLEGLAWMKEMEKTQWKGGLLGDEMGLGKTIQAVSLIMSDWPAKRPTLVLAPPVALVQWMTEIESYTDGTLKTMVYHGSNTQTKRMQMADLRELDVIIMSYNSLESMYRKQEKGFRRKEGIVTEESLIHRLTFHRVVLDEAHSIKTRQAMTSKACFALKTEFRWCLSGTPVQNRIGEFFSLIRFLKVQPFSNYLCKNCPCSSLEWTMDEDHNCLKCKHGGLRHVSVFNQELLNPIQKYGNTLAGREAFAKLSLLTSRIMLRRQKKDHMDAMELPVKQISLSRQVFGEEELDFAGAIMHGNQRKFDTYVAAGVVLNNYANIFALLTQMRLAADHPDLILKKHNEGGQNVLVCCICDDAAEDAIRSQCHHDFCRSCASSYLGSTETPSCPQCHIALSIDLEQPEVEQDAEQVKKSSIINRIRMEQWTSSTKIEMLVHELQKLRSDSATHKSIVFSQFTSMLQLIEWRLRRAGITTVMLDGSMTPAQRAASIAHFMGNIDTEVFLVSLRAGGVALNLTEASRVFIVDPWWNPSLESQSMDRIHRIGQTRPCIITRFCIEDSIESRIVQLQEKKAKMFNSTVNADGAALDSLEPEDLQFLFRGT